jgi:hypothetical protein
VNSTPLTTETNLAFARAYIDVVFNAHEPDLAAECRTPDVKWHGGKRGSIEGGDNIVGLVRGFGVPPAGNHLQWTAVDIYRIEDGKIAEEWAADDLTAVLHDMGVYTAPWL